MLVHGTPTRSFLWRNVAPALAERFSVHVFDLLGFGDSERHDDQPLSVATHAKVLAELVSLWDLEEPALVGHDIGGATVLRAHLLHGVAARRLGLIDAVVLRPWITSATRHIKAHLEVYRTMPANVFEAVTGAHLRTATFRAMDDATFAAYHGQWEGEPGRALWLRNVAGFDESHTAEFEDRLPTMETPTLVIWGRDDAWLDPEVGERIEAMLPNAERLLVAEAGHFAMEDQPEIVAHALIEFLERDA